MKIGSRNFDIAAALLILFSFFTRYMKFARPIISEVILILLALSIFISVINKNGLIRISQEAKPFIVAMLLLMLILFVKGQFFSNYNQNFWHYYTFYLISFALMIRKWNDEDVVLFVKAFRVLSIISVLSLLASIIKPNLISGTFGFLYSPTRIYALDKEMRLGMYSGFLAEKAHAAHMLVMALGIELAAIVNRKWREINYKHFVLVLVYLLAIMATSKRTLFLTAIILVAIAFLLSDYKNKAVRIVPTVVIFVSAVLIIMYAVPAVNITVTRLLESNDDISNMNGRSEFWEVAFQMFRENPLMGTGLGSYSEYQNVNSTIFSYEAHNSYIQILGETGIIGASLLIGLLIAALNKSVLAFLKYRNPMSALIMYWQIASALYALTGNVLHSNSQMILWFMAISWLIQGRYSDEFII